MGVVEPKWDEERRDVLRRALRKAQAAQQQSEVARLTGQEGLAIYEAAQCWEDMMTMLDAHALVGNLQALRP